MKAPARMITERIQYSGRTLLFLIFSTTDFSLKKFPSKKKGNKTNVLDIESGYPTELIVPIPSASIMLITRMNLTLCNI